MRPGRISVPRRVVSQKLGDEMVLLHLDTGVYWSLNSSGAMIWQRLQAGGTAREACGDLCEKFDTDEAEAGEAVQQLIEDLLKQGLLEQGSSAK